MKKPIILMFLIGKIFNCFDFFLHENSRYSKFRSKRKEIAVLNILPIGIENSPYIGKE